MTINSLTSFLQSKSVTYSTQISKKQATFLAISSFVFLIAFPFARPLIAKAWQYMWKKPQDPNEKSQRLPIPSTPPSATNSRPTHSTTTVSPIPVKNPNQQIAVLHFEVGTSKTDIFILYPTQQEANETVLNFIKRKYHEKTGKPLFPTDKFEDMWVVWCGNILDKDMKVGALCEALAENPSNWFHVIHKRRQK